MRTGRYDPRELEHLEAVLHSAVEDARRLGVSFASPDEEMWVRTCMATAIFDGASSGERDATRLRAYAVATVLEQGMCVLEMSEEGRAPRAVRSHKH